jgi:hypothetical protein
LLRVQPGSQTWSGKVSGVRQSFYGSCATAPSPSLWGRHVGAQHPLHGLVVA